MSPAPGGGYALLLAVVHGVQFLGGLLGTLSGSAHPPMISAAAVVIGLGVMNPMLLLLNAFALPASLALGLYVGLAWRLGARAWLTPALIPLLLWIPALSSPARLAPFLLSWWTYAGAAAVPGMGALLLTRALAKDG